MDKATSLRFILPAAASSFCLVMIMSLTNVSVFAQSSENASSFKTITVVIPKEAANPTPDLTLKNINNWYKPDKMTISAGDTVVWQNQDIDSHTVTSGQGAGIASVQTNQKGKPDGLFDSGIFGPGKTWSHTFYYPGTYSYFCSIHPWMEGVVTVSPLSKTDVPSYPVDSSGNKLTLPLYQFTQSGITEVGINWDPTTIMTGQNTTFILDFYDKANNRLQVTPYDFVLIQDGKEIDRSYALTENGIGVFKYVFAKPGPLTIRVENIADKQDSSVQFATYVYPNPDSTTQTASLLKLPGGTEQTSRILNPLTLVTIAYVVIFGIPAAVGVTVYLYKKGKI